MIKSQLSIKSQASIIKKTLIIDGSLLQIGHYQLDFLKYIKRCHSPFLPRDDEYPKHHDDESYELVD